MFALISLPLPSKIRRPMLRTLSIPFHSQQFQMILKCVFVFIGIMFADSINRTIKVTNELYSGGMGNSFSSDIASGGISRAEIQSRRFYSQRNMYLCGFTLFLTLIITRTYSMVFELLDVKEKVKKLESELTLNGNTDDETKLRLRIKELEAEKATILKKSKALSDEY